MRKQGFGGLWHLVNHAAATVELDRLGYKQLGRNALGTHLLHVRLWRSLPHVESELGPMPRSQHDPPDPAYWEGIPRRHAPLLTRRTKTLYGHFTIRRSIENDATRQQADDALRYLMA